jgi:hypothetical protein
MSCEEKALLFASFKRLENRKQSRNTTVWVPRVVLIFSNKKQKIAWDGATTQDWFLSHVSHI